MSLDTLLQDLRELFSRHSELLGTAPIEPATPADPAAPAVVAQNPNLSVTFPDGSSTIAPSTAPDAVISLPEAPAQEPPAASLPSSDPVREVGAPASPLASPPVSPAEAPQATSSAPEGQSW